jgi:hypothetical protein
MFPSNTIPANSFPSLPDKFKSIVGEKGKFIVYCGAGISIPSPSCIPDWRSLSAEIIKGFFSKVKPEWVPRDFTASLNYPPEMVFESFGSVLGDRFYECFKALDAGKPNANHQALAALAKTHQLKAIWTTNFDELLEKALTEAGVEFIRLVNNDDYDKFNLKKGSDKVLICKIHGTTSLPSSIVAVASAYKGSSGFSAPKARILEAQLKEMPLLFLGYSGWDFEHENYIKFWESVGPSVKRIIYNIRPSDTMFPPFNHIFKTTQHVQFVASELPQDLIKCAPPFTAADKDDSQWGKFKEDRERFFVKWASNLPNTHIIALAMTTAMMFSERSKAMAKQGQDMAEDSEASTVDGTKYMMDLAADLSAQKITTEQYMEKISEYTEMQQLIMVPKSKRVIVRQWIKDNIIPGIRDDYGTKSTFLGRVAGYFAAGFRDDDDILRRIKELYVEDERIKTLTDEKEKLARQVLQGYRTSIASKDSAMEQKYLGKLEDTLQLHLQGKFADDMAFYKALTDIIGELSREKTGMQVKASESFDTLVKEVCHHVKDDEQLIVFASTLTGLFHYYLFGEIAMWDEKQKLYQLMDSPNFTEEQFLQTPFWSKFETLFSPIHTAIQKGTPFQRGCVELPMMLILVKCAMVYNRKDWNGHNAYYGGYATLNGKTLMLYEFIKKRLGYGKKDGCVEAILASKNSLLIQRACDLLTELAQVGDDIEMAKRAYTLSMEVTDNKITEMTPYNIPCVVASMIEMIENKPLDALPYFIKGLDGILLTQPTMHQDILIHRCVEIIGNDSHLSGEEKKKKIVEIMSKYALKYNHHMRSSYAFPARALAEEKADKICKANGGKSLDECVKEFRNAMVHHG